MVSLAFNSKNTVVVLGLVFILGLSFLVYLVIFKEPKSQVCYEDMCFKVEVARTDEEHVRGLSNRQKLEEDKGMFFIFDGSDKYTFWMKNTLIPLDIIWIDESAKVVYIKEDVESCEGDTCEMITPDKEAKYVLEINGGKAEDIGLDIGDTLKISEDLE